MISSCIHVAADNSFIWNNIGFQKYWHYKILIMEALVVLFLFVEMSSQFCIVSCEADRTYGFFSTIDLCSAIVTKTFVPHSSFK